MGGNGRRSDGGHGARRRRIALGLVVALALAGAACSDGGDDGDGGAGGAGGATTTTAVSSATTAPPDTRFEGLPEDALPDFVDPALLDGLQRCYTVEIVGEETFTYADQFTEQSALTPGLRDGFLALRDCLEDVDGEMSCLDALAPLAPGIPDEDYLAALMVFSECTQAQLGG